MQSFLSDKDKNMTATVQRAALLTKHQKLALIAPALAEAGINIELTEAFDTDRLGTFSAEVPRTLSPLDCVKAKAKLAAELTGLPLGIGSEGSFGGGPAPGLLNWDDELLCLFDSTRQQYVIASSSGPVALSDLQADTLEKIYTHIDQHPVAQGWICHHSQGMLKGLSGRQALEQALQQADLVQPCGKLREVVRLTPDFRAHLCPARQDYIQQAARQLADRLRSHCPHCTAPDFWRKKAEAGLPCSACHYPTQRVKHYIKACDCCSYTEVEAAAELSADPGHCPLCNP